MSEPKNWADAQIWLRYAREDLQAAEELITAGITQRNACFLAQQSAGKGIKAILVFRQVDFPKSHDLLSLRYRVNAPETPPQPSPKGRGS